VSLSSPTDLGADLSRAVIDHRPHPPRLAWAAHKAPHGLPRGCLSLVDDDLSLLRIQTLEQSFIDVLQCGLFFLRVLMTGGD
jgi:hypothetical protein